MPPFGHGGLAEGANSQWNIVASLNNPNCDNKFSAPLISAANNGYGRTTYG